MQSVSRIKYRKISELSLRVCAYFVALENPSRALIEKSFYYINKRIDSKSLTTKNVMAKQVLNVQRAYVMVLNGKLDFETARAKYWTDADTQLLHLYLSPAKKSTLHGCEKSVASENVWRESVATLSGTKTPAQIAEMKFDTLDMGDFAGIMGKVTNPFVAMIAGSPGGGKTTFALAFLRHLCTHYANKRALFVSHEEAENTLQDKIKRLQLEGIHNLQITQHVPANWTNYDFVLLDSMNALGISADKFRTMIQQAKKNKTSMIAIFQATKAGSFKGENAYEHDVEISLQTKKPTTKNNFKGIIEVRKNRYGGAGELDIFNYMNRKFKE